MNTVTVPERSKVLNDLLKKARNANVLLRLESGEQFVLAKVSSAQSFYVGDSDDFDEEVKMNVRQQKANEISG